MEPITVLHEPLSCEWIERLKHSAFYKLLVREPLSPLRIDDDLMEEKVVAKTVTIRFEPIYRGRDVWFWMVLTNDSENALKLRSVFLPGQQSEANERWRQGFQDALGQLFR